MIVVGGHLDSWDVGEGAHDDGTGIVQSIEVLRTFKKLGIKIIIRSGLFVSPMKKMVSKGDSIWKNS